MVYEYLRISLALYLAVVSPFLLAKDYSKQPSFITKTCTRIKSVKPAWLTPTTLLGATTAITAIGLIGAIIFMKQQAALITQALLVTDKARIPLDEAASVIDELNTAISRLTDEKNSLTTSLSVHMAEINKLALENSALKSDWAVNSQRAQDLHTANSLIASLQKERDHNEALVISLSLTNHQLNENLQNCNKKILELKNSEQSKVVQNKISKESYGTTSTYNISSSTIDHLEDQLLLSNP
jgi:hypothetical protein